MHSAVTSPRPRVRLLGALIELRDRAAAARLPLDVAGAADARRGLAGLARQLADYVIPRLRQPDAPLLVVIGGPTGAGKSTLFNSLAGQPISPAGVLRPTTRGPVLACHPDDLAWFVSDRVLPEFPRVTGDPDGQAAGSLRVAQAPRIPTGLALVDAPDIDSVVAANHDLAAQLLSAADLWIFVTTAARYADAIPWELLSTARRRGTALSMLLNRVSAEAAEDVTGHLASLLDRYGLGATPLFVASECALGPGGLLPQTVVDPLEGWLDGLSSGSDHRAQVVRGTLDGTLDSYRGQLTTLAGAADKQVAGLGELRSQVDASVKAAAHRASTVLADGSLMHGELLARWSWFAGTGDVIGSMRAAIGRLRDRLAAAMSGQPQPGTEVRRALAGAVIALIQSATADAAGQVVSGWRAQEAGARLMAQAGISGTYDVLRAIAAGHAEGAVSEVARWQDAVVALVKERGAARRLHPRYVTFGAAGVGVLLMIAAVTPPDDGPGRLSRRHLATIVGETAAGTMAAAARDDLVRRVESVLASAGDGFAAMLDSVRIDPTLGAWLRCQLEAIDAARGVSV